MLEWKAKVQDPPILWKNNTKKGLISMSKIEEAHYSQSENLQYQLMS